MCFRNQNGQEVKKDEWVNLFEPYYFLDGPTHGRHINQRNQTSRYVENNIEQILIKGLSPSDIPLIIAWKIGAIDHRASEEKKLYIYKNNYNNNFEFPDAWGKIKAREIIEYCQNNFNELTEIKEAELFNRIKKYSGRNNRFGIVKWISLLYFFTKGNWPIYDKFSHIAVDAISLNKHPGEVVNYTQINGWQDYRDKYISKIVNIFGTQNIPRQIDRSLWVYGHFFSNRQG